MKGLIIYKSKYGSTKQLSEWLNENIKFDLFEVSNRNIDLLKYEVVVIGCSIHGGIVSLNKWIINRWKQIKSKSVVLMLTSGTADIRFIQKTMSRSFPEEITKSIKLFPVGGRYVFNKMSIIDRFSIKVVAYFTKHPDTKKGMLTERDDVNRNNLEEIIQYLTKKNV